MDDHQTQTLPGSPDEPADQSGSGHPAARGRRRRRWIAVGVVAVLLIGGAGYGAARFFSEADDRAIDLVPKDAMAYANLFLEPSTAQRQAIRDLLERFPVATPERAEGLIADLLDEPLGEIGLEFEEDVKGWLGDQIAGFVLPPETLEGRADGGVLIATTDEAATRAALGEYRAKNDVGVERGTYKGHDVDVGSDGTVTGFIESFLFIGSRRGFHAAADAEASERSLAESPTYRDAVRGLETDRLAIAYLDTSGLLEAVRRGGGAGVGSLQELGLTDGTTQAAVMYVEPHGLIVDQASYVPGGQLGREIGEALGEPGVMERLPRDAWLAVNIPNLGGIATAIFSGATALLPGGLGPAAANERIRRDTGLDLATDVFAWLDDGALYVSGTNRVDIGGGILLSSSDPAASGRAVHKIAGVLIARGVPVEQRTWTRQGNIDRGDDGRDTTGYAIDIGAEGPVNLVADEDRVVLAYGDEATGQALAASSYLGDGLEWRESLKTLDKDYVPFFYVDLQAAKGAIEGSGADADPVFVEDVRPWLEPLSHVLSGARRDGERMLTRTVIGVL